MENRRHKVFIFQMSKLDTEINNEKLEEIFNKSIPALKSTLLWVLFFEFLRLVHFDISSPIKIILWLKIPFALYYSRLDNSSWESKNTDIVEQCTQARQTTKWRFKLITNANWNVRTRHTKVNCLLSIKVSKPYKDHSSLFCEMTMYMKGQIELDFYTSRCSTEFITKCGYDTKIFRGVSVED